MSAPTGRLIATGVLALVALSVIGVLLWAHLTGHDRGGLALAGAVLIAVLVALRIWLTLARGK
jgi:pilus assembly protein TadC